jgi:hypothetical protein
MDKSGRFLPWVQKQKTKYSATADLDKESLGKLRLLEEMEKLAVDGVWDWQMGSE